MRAHLAVTFFRVPDGLSDGGVAGVQGGWSDDEVEGTPGGSPDGKREGAKYSLSGGEVDGSPDREGKGVTDGSPEGEVDGSGDNGAVGMNGNLAFPCRTLVHPEAAGAWREWRAGWLDTARGWQAARWGLPLSPGSTGRFGWLISCEK